MVKKCSEAFWQYQEGQNVVLNKQSRSAITKPSSIPIYDKYSTSPQSGSTPRSMNIPKVSSNPTSQKSQDVFQSEMRISKRDPLTDKDERYQWNSKGAGG